MTLKEDLSELMHPSGHEIEEIDGKKILALGDVYGSQIHIGYRGKEVFLALEKNKRRLEI